MQAVFHVLWMPIAYVYVCACGRSNVDVFVFVSHAQERVSKCGSGLGSSLDRSLGPFAWLLCYGSMSRHGEEGTWGWWARVCMCLA